MPSRYARRDGFRPMASAAVADAAIQRLTAARPQLSEADQAVADSIIDWYRVRGLSAAQASLADRLSERAAQPVPAARRIEGALRGAVELLERAGQRMRFPALLVMGEGLRPVRLTMATARARVPGSITVTSVNRIAGGERAWYGRVTREGEYQPSRALTAETVTAITAGLQAIAADPVAACARYGHLTGHCCFCGRRLDDERSTAVGYGATCAATWGMPWGTRAAREAARPAPAPVPAPVSRRRP